MIIEIPTRVITFTAEELEKWKNYERDDCIDTYCKKLRGSYGFGEYKCGKFYESEGYKWIHHDFDIFGANKFGKYPEAEHIINNIVGHEKYKFFRSIYPLFKPLEQPDLLIYKPDFSEIRFTESKRIDTGDKIRESQVKGLALLSVLLGCHVEVIDVVLEGKNYKQAPIRWEIQLHPSSL